MRALRLYRDIFLCDYIIWNEQKELDVGNGDSKQIADKDLSTVGDVFDLETDSSWSSTYVYRCAS